ncbi:MAG: molybdopterin converting factor subunit 1 [Pseudomonadales bacterium]
MLKVLFFAKLREELGTAELSLADENAVTTSQLRQILVDKNGEQWRDSLFANNIIVAVNQEVVDWSHPVKAGDEIAFFPPVTGG